MACEKRGFEIPIRFKGTAAKDLPIEQEERWKLVVNQKTARALGIKIPESILLRADEVIR